MNKVCVVGLGPGDNAYMLPASLEAVANADVIVGARRHLDALRQYGKQIYEIKHRFSDMIEFIRDNAQKKRIAVVVSGDTGFYSLLRYLKNNLEDVQFDVVPGLSSMVLMFARLGFMHDDAYTGSVHGKHIDAVKLVREYKKVGLLTDGKTTPSAIAKTLLQAGMTGKCMAIGERLSYENECIRKMTLETASTCSADTLCVVVIYDEDVCI